jgi:hypothetical protein
MLCRHGAAVGDDEMTVHLRYIQVHSSLNVIGILSWHASMNIWVSSPLWIQGILDKEDQQAIAVIFHCNHRIHVHFNPGECCVTYWNGVVFPSNIRIGYVRSLPKVVKQSEICTNSRHHGLVRVSRIGPAVLHCRMPRPDQSAPTSPSFHGEGHQEVHPSALLKNAGRTAGILIAKGHQSEEAMQVAQKLADMNLAKCRNLGSVKENKAYSIMLEPFVEHHMEIKSLFTSQAVQRLQAIFRSKRPQRSQVKVSEVDITKETFLPVLHKTFTKFVTPQPAWSPATQGLATGTPKEVHHVADQANLINCALTSVEVSCKDPAKCHGIVVPVQDGVGNKALVTPEKWAYQPAKVCNIVSHSVPGTC